MSLPAPFAAELVLAASAALTAAADTGLLERLHQRPVTATDVAEELDLDPCVVERTLDALVAIGVAEADGEGRVGADPAVSRMLAGSRERFASLAEVLRGGARTAPVDQPTGARALYARCAAVLGDAFTEAADELAAHLAGPDGGRSPGATAGPGARGPRVLDVGAGAAPWSLALLRRRPGARVVGLDLPGVIGTTRRAVEDAGVSDAYTLVGADLFDGGLEQVPGSFDVIVAGNLLHLFDAERAGRLVGALAERLVAGGRLAIVDVLLDGDGPDRGVALYALGLALRTATGGLHAREDYERWLDTHGVGLSAVHRSDTVPVLALLVGTKQP